MSVPLVSVLYCVRSKRWLGGLVCAVALSLVLLAPAAYAIEVGPVQVVSSSSNGTPANYTTQNGRVSRDIAWSPDSTKIAFRSDATNLVADPPTDGQFEVYVKNIGTNQTTMVSRQSDGSTVAGDAGQPQWSRTEPSLPTRLARPLAALRPSRRK